MQQNVSTIIPIFGEADLAERSVDSVLSQDYENKSTIICFDQVSPSREAELEKQYDKDVSLIRRDENRLYALANI